MSAETGQAQRPDRAQQAATMDAAATEQLVALGIERGEAESMVTFARQRGREIAAQPERSA